MSPEESVNLSLRLPTDVRRFDVVEGLNRPLSCLLLLLVDLVPLRARVLGCLLLISLFYHALLLLLLVLRIQLLVLLYLLVQLRCKQWLRLLCVYIRLQPVLQGNFRCCLRQGLVQHCVVLTTGGVVY